MTVLSIVKHPDPQLRQVAQPITCFDTQVEKLATDLIDTLHHHGGIGLAAPQVAQSYRIVIADLSDDQQTPVVYVNPEIVASSKRGFVQESCLSIPGVSGNVVRATEIELLAQDLRGNSFSKTLNGMHAVCLQHEIDHLDGILFIDRFTKLRKMKDRLTSTAESLK